MSEAEGFGVIPNWVVRETDLSAYALLVYVAISGRANRSRECWPSWATLAKEARCSISTAKRAVKELQAAGLLVVVERRALTGGHSSNLYRLILDAAGGGSQGTSPQVTHEGRGGSHGTPEEDTREEDTLKALAVMNPDEEAHRVIAGLIADNVENVTGVRPKITQTWLRDIRLLCERDGYTIPQVIWVANWLVQDKRFWYRVTLSPAKFRKNFGAIVGEARVPVLGDKAAQREAEENRVLREMQEAATVAAMANQATE